MTLLELTKFEHTLHYIFYKKEMAVFTYNTLQYVSSSSH